MSYIKKKLKKLSYDEYESLRVIRFFFWKINWLKTIWLNLKVLPFKHAVKFPILVAYNTQIRNTGNIVFTNKIYTGMVSIGVIRIPSFESNYAPTIFNNCGTLYVGGRLKLHPGAIMSVAKGAIIKLGNHVGFGSNTKIICRRSIIIGNDVQISWNSQVLDSDFHFLYNIERNEYYQRNKAIVIGDNVFVGNGTTIGKGTILSNGSVVSCISKVSGDFSSMGDNLLISGNPAKVVKKGVRISNGWYVDKELEIAKLLNE